MGSLARYISGKSGGLGEVVSALSEGLLARGINCHLATINLRRRFKEESGMDEHAWRQVRDKVDPDKIHLVSSSIYANLLSPYSGDPLSNAAEFQKELVNNTIKTVRARCGGRLIVHSHDWMAGGAVTAYAKSRDCPVLHTVHNVHTGHVPLDMLFGVDIDSLTWNIYFSKENGRICIDSQATAIKSATLVNFVGEKFLREIIEDYFWIDHSSLRALDRKSRKSTITVRYSLSSMRRPLGCIRKGVSTLQGSTVPMTMS